MALFGTRSAPARLVLSRARRSARFGLQLLAVGALFPFSPSARADKVYLQSGSVLEGEATREGDKVLVQLESGSIRLPASSVLRVERGTTELAQITRLRAQLAEGAIEQRLVLADRCRAAQLARCERQLLEEVIARVPDHADARARLGYVRGEQGGWIARSVLAQRQRAQAEEARAQSERARAESALAREATELARRQAELALERERLALRKAELEQRASAWFVPVFFGTSTHATPTLSAPQAAPYAINGVRLPSEQGFNMPGVRPPQSYFR